MLALGLDKLHNTGNFFLHRKAVCLCYGHGPLRRDVGECDADAGGMSCVLCQS